MGSLNLEQEILKIIYFLFAKMTLRICTIVNIYKDVKCVPECSTVLLISQV